MIATYILSLAICLAGQTDSQRFLSATEAARKANTQEMEITSGPFKPDWDSLNAYTFPDWYRDAKFGIWAHWGPQCQPEMGDWYAKGMYMPLNKQGKANEQYLYHLKKYGHPSVFGFKDVIHTWKVEKWDPRRLVALYKKSGAKFFVAMANHHDNMDLWDSKYQPWNSVLVGPGKDIISEWMKAAKAEGLPFGVSVHAGRAKGWLSVSKNADKQGEMAGIPYDGLSTSADGRGKWWEGLDPQDLYVQSLTKEDYNRRFYNRTLDLIRKYPFDLLYFDDDYTNTGLPLYNSDPTIGLRIVADFYNNNILRNGGKLQGIIAAKKLTPERRKVLTYDIERGGADDILPQPWQTDTCIGQWHYSKAIADRNGYRKASEIIRMLADIVSKNGNLMLSIPVRADGSIDNHEIAILEEVGAWLTSYGEAIYATRPWKVYGQGPDYSQTSTSIATGEVVEKKTRQLGAEDVRYTVSKDGKLLYAIVLGWPSNGQITLKNLAVNSPLYGGSLGTVTVLGSAEELNAIRNEDGLAVTLPGVRPVSADTAWVLKIELKE